MLARALGTQPGKPHKHTAGRPRRKSDLAPWRTLPKIPSQLPREAGRGGGGHVQKHSPSRRRPCPCAFWTCWLGLQSSATHPRGQTLRLLSLPSHLQASLKASAFCQASIPNLLSRPGENVSEIFPESHCQEPEFLSLHLPSGCLQTSPWVLRLRPPPPLIHFPHCNPKAC